MCTYIWYVYYLQELDNARCACKRFVMTQPFDIYFCLSLSFTAVNSLAMFLLTWPPWHPSPSQRLSSAHNLASRIGRSMRSVSSWRSKEPWNTCQARFVDRFFFSTTRCCMEIPSCAWCWAAPRLLARRSR